MSPTPFTRSNAARYLEDAAFLLLVGLAALRPLIGETYDTAADPFTQSLHGLTQAGPARTAAFDLIVLVAVALWLISQVLRPSRFRWTGLEAGLLLLALASLISTAFAGNKRLAINAAVDWLCMPLAAIALVQLLRSPWQFRVLLGAVLASAAVNGVQCFEQYVTFDDTWAHYQSIREQFWAAQGVSLDSGRVDLFEQRIKAADVSGFFAHSNVAGAYLILCSLAAVGAAVVRWRQHRDSIKLISAVIASLVAVLLAVAAGLTHSLGAMLSAVGALGLGWVVWVVRRWLRLSRRTVLWAGWVVIVMGGAAVVVYGVRNDGLPNSSLNFRWQYWATSCELISDHLLTGVGRENFSRHYLRYKPIEAPEEIANPHNLFVHATAELGIVGLAGLLVMLVGGSIIATGAWRKPLPDRPCGASIPDRSPASTSRLWVLWGVGLLSCVTFIRIPLLGTNDVNLVYYATVVTGILWAVVFFALAPEPDEGNKANHDTGDQSGNGRSVFWIGLALFAFLLHETINFALFVPGSAYTFFMLSAYVLAFRTSVAIPQERSAGGGRWLGLGGSVAGIMAVLIFVLVPGSRVSSALRLADSAVSSPLQGPISGHPAWRLYTKAAEADPLDPTPWSERARWLLSIAVNRRHADEATAQAAAAVDEAIRRDPFNVSLCRLRRRIQATRAAATGTSADFLKAIQAAEAAISLYPESPSDIIALAEAQAKAGLEADLVQAQRAGLLNDAINSYREALDLDARRPAWERHRRLSPSELEAVRVGIEQAQNRLDELADSR